MKASTRRQLATIGLLTLGMGTAVTISWLAFAARIQVYDFSPTTIFSVSRMAAYGTQFLLVAALVYVVARRRLPGVSFGSLIGIVTAAWVGEGLVLTIIGEPLVANELDPSVAWWYWLVATAGPLQPVAGVIGGWLGVSQGARGSSG
jgi:hypothetical protein